MNLEEFEKWCLVSWGSEVRGIKQLIGRGTKQIRNNIDFNNITQEVKLRMAEKLILESCSHIGSYASSGDDRWYIKNFTEELFGNYEGFDGRSTEPLKAALILLTYIDYGSTSPDKRGDFEHICTGGGAMVAMYLMAHSEHLFRINGRYLNDNGSIKKNYLKPGGKINKIPNQLRRKASVKQNYTRINKIDQAFIMYLYRNRSTLAKRLISLDKNIAIVRRLKRIRNPVMHGELADPSSEAMFFGLMTAMFYYGSNL